MTTMSEENEMQIENNLSALRENISSKGKNSYYYAHGTKINGPAWDGQEQPRLIDIIDPTLSNSTTQALSFNEYSWSDGNKFVNIYIDFEGCDDISDDNISLTTNSNSFEFSVIHQEKNYKLVVSSLSDLIESATYKKKSTKFVISLKKSAATSWGSLIKK